MKKLFVILTLAPVLGLLLFLSGYGAVSERESHREIVSRQEVPR